MTRGPPARELFANTLKLVKTGNREQADRILGIGEGRNALRPIKGVRP